MLKFARAGIIKNKQIKCLATFSAPPPFLLRIDIVYSMQYSFSPPIHCFEINAEKKGFFPCFVIGSYTCLFIYFTLTKQFFVYLIFFFSSNSASCTYYLIQAQEKKTRFLQIAAKMRSCLAPFFFLFLFIYLLILYTYIFFPSLQHGLSF